MDFETEKLLAKISGENVEDFACKMLSDADKAQIEFAFNQIFSGMSLLEWNAHTVLSDAWKIALDKLRDFIFSLPQKNYIVEYLHNAVFKYKSKKLWDLQKSIHSNEYFHCSEQQRKDLEHDAQLKIQQGAEIIMNLVSVADNQNIKNQKITQKQNVFIKTKERERENEREHER